MKLKMILKNRLLRERLALLCLIVGHGLGVLAAQGHLHFGHSHGTLDSDSCVSQSRVQDPDCSSAKSDCESECVFELTSHEHSSDAHLDLDCHLCSISQEFSSQQVAQSEHATYATLEVHPFKIGRTFTSYRATLHPQAPIRAPPSHI